MVSAGMLVLLVAAIKKRNSKTCKGYRIEIKSAENRPFIDRKDVMKMLSDSFMNKPEGRPISSFDLLKMEGRLKKEAWVKNAELFFDNNDLLRIVVTQRDPVARIFTVGGNSFYIDSSGEQLLLNEKQTVMLPVFTGYPFEKVKQAGADGMLLKQIKSIDAFILKDPFWLAQIAQIDIAPDRTFEMVPVVGGHIIEFGDGNNCEEKFHRLFVFYKEVLSKTGFDKYAKVDVRFDGEVIGTRKGGLVTKTDSLQAVKNIAMLIRSAQQLQIDTVRQRTVKPLENLGPDKDFKTGDIEDTIRKK